MQETNIWPFAILTAINFFSLAGAWVIYRKSGHVWESMLKRMNQHLDLMALDAEGRLADTNIKNRVAQSEAVLRELQMETALRTARFDAEKN